MSQGSAPGHGGHVQVCEVCGRPGQVRHFPGPSPSTGVWCDRHHERLLWLHPMGWHGRRLCLVVIAGVLVAWAWWQA